jgi:segregation and condensation protein B
MATEINLFDQEIELAAPEATRPTTEPLSPPASKSKPQPVQLDLFESQQPMLPGMSENIQAAQQTRQQERLIRQHTKRIVEALLFASNEPLSFNKIKDIVDSSHHVKPRQLKDLLSELQNEYLSQQRAFRLEEIAEGFLLRTCEEYKSYIDLLYSNKRGEKVSQAAAEVLAIIAYRQPVTRPQIEAIRGVDCSGIVYNLLERQLIEPVGRLEAPGRPTLYGVTKDFLTHFGLRDAQQLQDSHSDVKINSQ